MEFLTVCNFTLVSNQNLKVDDLNLPEIGPKFEHHEMFPARTNTGLWRLILYRILSLYLLRLSYNSLRFICRVCGSFVTFSFENACLGARSRSPNRSN